MEEIKEILKTLPKPSEKLKIVEKALSNKSKKDSKSGKDTVILV